MKYFLKFLILAITCFSCGGNDGTPDVVKFKSGAYGSKAGQFIAEFPGEPTVNSEHYQMGSTAEYDEFFFQYKIVNEHIYSVSYVDFPEIILESWDTEQLFDQSIKTISTQLDEFKITERKVNNEKTFEKSITYTLYSSTPGAMMKAKLVKHGDRIYQIFFACTRRQPENEKIDAFIDSFKIYQSKENT